MSTRGDARPTGAAEGGRQSSRPLQTAVPSSLTTLQCGPSLQWTEGAAKLCAGLHLRGVEGEGGQPLHHQTAWLRAVVDHSTVPAELWVRKRLTRVQGFRMISANKDITPY